MILPRAFYDRPTLLVARDLIGKLLVHVTPAGRTSGVIVEVEAYVGEDDPACHAAAGPTRRNAPMYGPPGRAYVYFNYGMHHLVNAVTEAPGRPAAVLIRALDPYEGITLMRRRRARGSRRRPEAFALHELCRGPGTLTRALAIGPRQNRARLTGGPLHVEDLGFNPGPVAWSRRIGIRKGADREWRAFVEGHPAVSARLTPPAGGSVPSRSGS